MQVSTSSSQRGIGVFVMTLSGFALAGPFLVFFFFWALEQLGPLLLGDSTYVAHSEISVGGPIPGSVFLGVYILAFTAAFGWGFNLTRKAKSQP